MNDNEKRNIINSILKNRSNYKYGIYKDKIYLFPKSISSSTPPCELTKNEFEEIVGITSVPKSSFVYEEYIHIIVENKDDVFKLPLSKYNQYSDDSYLIDYIVYNAVLNFYNSNQKFFDKASVTVFNIYDYCESLEDEKLSNSYILKILSSFESRKHLYNDAFMGKLSIANHTVSKIETYINISLRNDIMGFALGKAAEVYDIGKLKGMYTETLYNKFGAYHLYYIPLVSDFPDYDYDPIQFKLTAINFLSKFDKEIKLLTELALSIEGNLVYVYINTKGYLVIQTNVLEG